MFTVNKQHNGYMCYVRQNKIVPALIDTGAMATVLGMVDFCWLTGQSPASVLDCSKDRKHVVFHDLSGEVVTLPHVLSNCVVGDIKLDYFPCFVRSNPDTKGALLGRDFIYACGTFGKDSNWLVHGIDKQALCIGNINTRTFLEEFAAVYNGKCDKTVNILTADGIVESFLDTVKHTVVMSNWDRYCVKFNHYGSDMEIERARLYKLTGAENEEDFEKRIADLL